MMRCSLGLLAGLAFLHAPAASAAEEIGKAVSVAPAVSGTGQGGARSIGSGDGVVRNELIQTAVTGNANLRFIDATKLSIGPSSSVRLDRFVFNPNGTAKNFVLNVAKGAFRFSTGNSNHRAYEIRTPAAVIGVRGTSFAFKVVGGRLTLTVFSGSVIVCPIGLSRASCYVATPGQTIAARAGQPVVVLSRGNAPGAPPPPATPGALVPISAPADEATPAQVLPPAPPPTIFTFGNCHVGINAGYVHAQQGDLPKVLPGDAGLAQSQQLGNVPSSLRSRRSGATAGGGFGCDIQLARVVVGAETDLAYTGLSDTARVTAGPARVTTTYQQSLDFLGTARVRVGIPVGPALVYGTGGLAYGNSATRASIVPPPTIAGQTLAGSESTIRVGWTLGAGVTYALSEHWSAKIEYLHYELGSHLLETPTVAGPPPRETAYFESADRGNLVRAGVDYRF